MAFNFFNRDKKQEFVDNNSTNSNTQKGNFAFSTPFLKVGGNNLSLPQIDRHYTQNGVVRFGVDNLYPQLLNQMYYTSPMHGALIEFKTNSIIGGGYSLTNDVSTLTAKVRVEWLTFIRKTKFDKLSRLLTRDYIIHNRVCIIVYRNEKGNLLKLKRIDPSTIRNYEDCERFSYSSDWSRGSVGSKDFNRYDGVCKDKETLYVYQDESPGQDVYPIPQYNSILNWCNLSGDIAFFQKNNIQNGVFPSAVIRRPKEFSSIDEIRKFKEEIGNNKGAENGGRLTVLTGNGMDDTPEFIQVNANNNDKLFESTLKDVNSEIAKGHKIDPALAGISISGSLGNSEQMEISYAIYDKDVVIPLRGIMDEILNDLLDIADINNTIVINDYYIKMDKLNVEETTSELEMEDDIENKSVINDALKGLTAAENSDIYRIIRDHSRDKLPDTIAVTRLRAYGLTDVEAREVLGL